MCAWDEIKSTLVRMACKNVPEQRYHIVLCGVHHGVSANVFVGSCEARLMDFMGSYFRCSFNVNIVSHRRFFSLRWSASVRFCPCWCGLVLCSHSSPRL